MSQMKIWEINLSLKNFFVIAYSSHRLEKQKF